MARKIRLVAATGLAGRAARKVQKRSLDAMNDLAYASTVLFRRPFAFAALALVILLSVTHTDDKVEGAIHDLAKSYPNNGILQYLSANIAKVIGFLCFVPALLVVPRRSMPVICWIVAAVIVAMLPVFSIYQYFTVAFCMQLYTQARTDSLKGALVLVIALYVVFGHDAIKDLPHPSKTFGLVNSSVPHSNVVTQQSQPTLTAQQVGEIAREQVKARTSRSS